DATHHLVQQPAELYDPATGTVQAIEQVAVLHTIAVRLNDGRVLLCAVGLTWTFDPATSSFGPFHAWAPPAVATATLLLDGRVLLTADGSAQAWLYAP
ncbi:MAG: hypothetical protein ACHQE5_09750, partial [Actinomycetes bacterium]